MKKSILLLGILLLLNVFTPTMANEADFINNEDYYREKCTGTLSSSDRGTCSDFQDYLNSKIETAQNSIDSLSQEISLVEDDIAKVDELIKQQQAEIEAAEIEIAYLDESITTLEGNIAELEIQIDERIEEIATVDQQIKNRIVAEQGHLHTNSLVNFLFGGNSYTELIRRSNTVDKINEYNKNQMDWFTEEKLRLEDDQAELSRQKLVLEETLENEKKLKASLEEAKAQSEATIAMYQEQVNDLTNKQLELQAQQQVSQSDIDGILDSFEELDNREAILRAEAARLAQEAEEARRRAQEAADEEARQQAEKEAQDYQDQSDQKNQEANEAAGSGGSWILPVSGGTISAGAWYYPGNFAGIFGGGIHYGVDFAVGVGTPVISTGPGVVVYTTTGCPTYGYLGNPCGGYGGNQVITIVSMNNKVYALWYAHLSQTYVSKGDVVNYGTIVGTTGSSGNSSGPHLHYEIYYLGDMTINQYLSTWNGSISFTNQGVSMNMNWICEVKGPPCRVNPQNWHGLTVGQRI